VARIGLVVGWVVWVVVLCDVARVDVVWMWCLCGVVVGERVGLVLLLLLL